MNDKSVLKSTWAAAFTVASVWFGTHVGGGFASGNQVIQYYSNYGYTSVIFPILAMGILAIVMYIMVKFAKLSGFDNYKDTYSALYPKPWMEVFFEIFYIIIVLAAIASAVAGAGEVLANFIGLNYVGSTKIIMNLIIVAVLIILTIFGVCLSTLHQSSLGALYLIAPGKLHPLWYSPFMPMFFFVSSMAAGCSMVIFEGMWAHKGVHHYMDETHLREADEVVFSFSKAGAFILFGYFMLKLIDMLVQANLPYLCTGYGLWWLVEMLFFVLTPALLYAKGSRDRNIKLCRFASANAVLGIVLNRFNVSMIAFNYALPADERYFPSIWEVCISIFVVTLIVTVYRFIVYHMPVLYEHPDFKDAH